MKYFREPVAARSAVPDPVRTDTPPSVTPFREKPGRHRHIQVSRTPRPAGFWDGFSPAFEAVVCKTACVRGRMRHTHGTVRRGGFPTGPRLAGRQHPDGYTNEEQFASANCSSYHKPLSLAGDFPITTSLSRSIIIHAM